jgi:hypothetical protein
MQLNGDNKEDRIIYEGVVSGEHAREAGTSAQSME